MDQTVHYLIHTVRNKMRTLLLEYAEYFRKLISNICYFFLFLEIVTKRKAN